jgi:AraC family transcriptional regulator of adaptative response / DNA-3-methyladenine glycosylase II
MLAVVPPFDLARTAAPVWWAGGRSPNVDWREEAFCWVGWEGDRVVWRSVRQVEADRIAITGSADDALDADWADRVLGVDVALPAFADPVMAALAQRHAGLRPWAAGSLFEGFVSAIVGQSISLAAAATTEQRLFQSCNDAIALAGRLFWPPPRPDQLAAASPATIRSSGVTMRRAEALCAMAARFAAAPVPASGPAAESGAPDAESFLEISGIGVWTVRSALLWGLALPDAHPAGDLALLRATAAHYADVATFRDLDRIAECWRPYRGWAARLLWLEDLGFPGPGC